MKKRISALLLSVILCFTLLSTAVFAVDAVTIKLDGTVEGASGDLAVWVDGVLQGYYNFSGLSDDEIAALKNWDENGDVEVEVSNGTKLPLMFEASSQDKVSITFDANGGTIDGEETATVDVEKDTTFGEIDAPTPERRGYTFHGWTLDASVTAIVIIDDDYVVADDVTVYAVWDEDNSGKDDSKNPVAPVGPSGKPSDPGTTDPGTDPTQPGSVSSIFTDVDGHWAVNNGAIQYVYDNKLMTGATATSFAPNATTTRAQIFVILARRAGVDTEGGSIWYQKGLDWMVANNYSDGTNPNSAITRQELAALLYRVIGAPEVTGNLAAYPDASAVSDWAVNGMLWATQNGIIEGNEAGALNPQDNATRAQVATILMRFCQQYPVQAPAAE